MAPKKSWKEKMEERTKGEIKQTDKGMMYISYPREIEKVIRSIPKGKLITTEQIVKKFTKQYKVDFTCPLTTGIFVSIVANYAEEQKESGAKELVPYWRVIKPKGYIYDKYLGQELPQKGHLESEGFKIIPRGTKKGPVVKDYEKYLMGI